MIDPASPLHDPPLELSRRQVLTLDGIRYAAEMVAFAYDRLTTELEGVSPYEFRPEPATIAGVFLYAWSIVDTVHRFRDLIDGLPGLKKGSAWKRLLDQRTRPFNELRDCVQHQIGEIPLLVQGQHSVWGYLNWAQTVEGRETGYWLTLVAGTIFKGDTWVTSAPSDRRGSVPKGRIRLSAFGRDAYLGEAVIAVRDAIRKLEGVIRSGGLRPEAVDEPYERTMRDFFVASGAYVVFQTKRPSSDGTD